MGQKARKYQCQKCNDNFHTLQDYCDHIGKHEQIKYKCTICGKSSDSKRSLLAHIKHHTDRFPCQSCGKILTSKPSLYNHQRIHTGQEDICKNIRNHLKAENHIWIMYLMATLTNL